MDVSVIAGVWLRLFQPHSINVYLFSYWKRIPKKHRSEQCACLQCLQDVSSFQFSFYNNDFVSWPSPTWKKRSFLLSLCSFIAVGGNHPVIMSYFLPFSFSTPPHPTSTHVLFNSSHEQMRSFLKIKNRWSSRKWRYVWVLRPICCALCPQDRPQKAIDICWWHLPTWIHLGGIPLHE